MVLAREDVVAVVEPHVMHIGNAQHVMQLASSVPKEVIKGSF